MSVTSIMSVTQKKISVTGQNGILIIKNLTTWLVGHWKHYACNAGIENTCKFYSSVTVVIFVMQRLHQHHNYCELGLTCTMCSIASIVHIGLENTFYYITTMYTSGSNFRSELTMTTPGSQLWCWHLSVMGIVGKITVFLIKMLILATKKFYSLISWMLEMLHLWHWSRN